MNRDDTDARLDTTTWALRKSIGDPSPTGAASILVVRVLQGTLRYSYLGREPLADAGRHPVSTAATPIGDSQRAGRIRAFERALCRHLARPAGQTAA